MNPFDIVNNINSKSKNLMRDSENDELSESSYQPYMVNRAMSYFYDTVVLSNIVNQWAHVDNRPQYEFYKNTVQPKKRFSKWAKSENDEVINSIIEVYRCNRKIAEQYASLMSKQQIETIKKYNNKGGK